MDRRLDGTLWWAVVSFATFRRVCRNMLFFRHLPVGCGDVIRLCSFCQPPSFHMLVWRCAATIVYCRGEHASFVLSSHVSLTPSPLTLVLTPRCAAYTPALHHAQKRRDGCPPSSPKPRRWTYWYDYQRYFLRTSCAGSTPRVCCLFSSAHVYRFVPACMPPPRGWFWLLLPDLLHMRTLTYRNIYHLTLSLFCLVS